MDLQSTNNEDINSPDNQSKNLSETEKWGSLLTGGALVLAGLSQRSLRGTLLAIAGGGLAYHGATAEKTLQNKVTEAAEKVTEKVTEATGLNKPIRVEKTLTIQNKSPEELYSFWRNFENLPSFMKHLKSVTILDATRSHWIANAPLDSSIEWDTEILTDQENQLIAWTSLEGSQVDNSGFVRFKPAPESRGTEVKVVLEYSPPGGGLSAAIAKVFGEAPEQQIGDDLRRFKMLMEAGEIATTEGQSFGKR